MCNHVILSSINFQAASPKYICVPCSYVQICVSVTRVHTERYSMYGISLCLEPHPLINFRKPGRGFLAILKCSAWVHPPHPTPHPSPHPHPSPPTPAASFIHLQAILPAMGCLITIPSPLPCSAQVRRIDQEQK